MEYECRLLGQCGNEFLIDCLLNGLSLARALGANASRVMSGRTLAFVPSIAAEDRTWRFNEGLMVGPTGGGRAVADFILARVVERVGAAVIGESTMSRPTDQSLESSHNTLLVCGGDVYPIVPGAQATRGHILDLIDHLDGLQRSLFFVVDAAPKVPAIGQHVVSRTCVERLAAGVQLAIATAYDGEGFVLWAPGPQLPDWGCRRNGTSDVPLV